MNGPATHKSGIKKILTVVYRLLAAAVLVLTAGCGERPGVKDAPRTDSQLAGTPAGDRHKIIIDTDIGEDIDDILVAAFALNSPEFEVLAITTVDGDVQARSRISRRLTQVFGQPEVQVAAGYIWNMPLADSPFTPEQAGITQGELAPDEEGLPPANPLAADALIAALAEKYPGQVSLLLLGSFANAGQLLVKYPQSAEKLKGIFTSGVIQGLEDHRCDWNISYDPLAAAVIMRSKVPWVIGPSNTVNAAGGLSWEDVRRLREAGRPTAALLARAVDLWKKNKKDASAQPHLADLSVFVCLLGGWVSMERYDVWVNVPPRDVWPRVEIEKNPAGRALVAAPLPDSLGPRLHDRVMERLLAPPGR